MSMGGLKRILGFTAVLVAGIISALAVGSGAMAVSGTTTATTDPVTTTSTTTTATAPTTTTAPTPVPNSPDAYRMLIVAIYGPIPNCTSKFCSLPLPNARAKIHDARGRLIRTVLTNSKGRAYIDFPRKSARYTMTISHAPFKGTRFGVKTWKVRTPFFSRTGVSQFRVYFCISPKSYEC